RRRRPPGRGDDPQPRRPVRRGRAHHHAAGRRPDPDPAARRAGPGARQGAHRQDGAPRVQAGGREGRRRGGRAGARARGRRSALPAPRGQADQGRAQDPLRRPEGHSPHRSRADAGRCQRRPASAIAVVLFMVIYYRLSGLIADVALVLNLLILLACMAAFGATLTLPGIAGIALTIGMAVDTNILIFERIREEMRVGKTPRASIDAGFSRALRTIIDTHLTVMVTAAILYNFGTGPVK